jgi:hypothetical protein
MIVITWVPDIVNSLAGVVTIPDLWNEYITIAVKYASIAVFWMSSITSQSTPVNVDGTVVKTTDVVALPFTAKAEQKVADKI